MTRDDEAANPAAGLQELVERPFPEFLAEFVRRHPVESRLLLGAAEVSPESAGAPRHAQSWAYGLFPAESIIDHREFDRAALALKVMQDVLLDNWRELPAVGAKNWDRMRRLLSPIQSDADLHALCWTVLFNDLGKVAAVAEHYAALHDRPAADHDDAFLGVLQADPGFFPTFGAIAPYWRRLNVEGLRSRCNIGKQVQMESPVGAWDDFLALPPETATFLFGHALFDVLGVTGAIDPTATSPAVANDRNLDAFFWMFDAGSVDGYAALRLSMAGLSGPADAGIDVPLARLVSMARVFESTSGGFLNTNWMALPPQVRAILAAELALDGRGGQAAIEAHYGPALLAAAKRAAPGIDWEGGLMLLARAFRLVRGELAVSDGPIVVANLHALALGIAERGLPAMLEADLVAERLDGGFQIRPCPAAAFDLDAFAGQRIGRWRTGRQVGHWLRGSRAAFMGIGGGSDCLQAAQVALESGANPACVISVRSAITAADASGSGQRVARTLVDHGGEVAPGVFRILPTTRGNGRFVECHAAARLATYLVLDAEDGSLATRVAAALQNAGGGIDTLVCVDTGGDALYGAGVEDATKATPDQDLRVLQAMGELPAEVCPEVLSLVLALGVDSPADAEAVLRAAGATTISFPADSRERILDRYAVWRAEAPEGFLGKTPLAWSLALGGASGISVLDLPTRLVTSPDNPWNPFVRVTPEMAKGFVMRVEDHLRALSRG